VFIKTGVYCFADVSFKALI